MVCNGCHLGVHYWGYYPGALYRQIITTHLRSGTRKFHLRVPNLQMSCMPFREHNELTAIHISIWHHITILFSSRSSLVCLNLLSSCLSYSCHILHYHVLHHIHIYWIRGWLNEQIHIKLWPIIAMQLWFVWDAADNFFKQMYNCLFHLD